MYFPDYEIFRIYNWEIAGLYQYYRIADNVSVLHRYYYIIKYSLAKTLADKHKSSVRKVMRKYFKEGRMQAHYLTQHVSKTVYLYDYGFTKQPILTGKSDKCQSKELLSRLCKGVCELCGGYGVKNRRPPGEEAIRIIRCHRNGAENVAYEPENTYSMRNMLRQNSKRILSQHKWRAVCIERCTYGSEASIQKPACG